MSNISNEKNYFFKSIFLFIFLFILWLLLSGHYNFLLISFGIVSSLLCVWLSNKMGLFNNKNFTLKFIIKLPIYWSWLIIEIIKSNISTAKIIINDNCDPEIFYVKSSSKSDIGKANYANSITLTPGTVTVEIDNDNFLIHALSSEIGEDLRTGEMDRKVLNLE